MIPNGVPMEFNSQQMDEAHEYMQQHESQRRASNRKVSTFTEPGSASKAAATSPKLESPAQKGQ